MVTFGKLSDMIENAGRFDMNQAVRFAMSKPESKVLVIHLNTRRQLYAQGIDALGVSLSDTGGVYTLYTLRRKEGRFNNVANRIDLFDTGEFYESFEVVAGEQEFTISADTIKEGEDLRGRWGQHIIGLTPDSREILAEAIRFDVVDWALGALLK